MRSSIRSMHFLCRELGGGGSDRHHLVAGVEGVLIAQDAPGDPGQLVCQGRRQLVAVQPWGRVLQPCSEAEALPVVRAHQDDVCSLDEQGPEVLASSLGDAAQNRSATCAVLTWDKTKPCSEVTPALECLAGTNGGHHGGRDQRTDAGNAHQATAVGFLLTDLVDLAGKCLDPLIERCPVLIQASNQAAHSGRYLVLTVLQDPQKGVAQSPCSSPDRNALLDQEGAYLIDCRCSSRDQAGAHAMQGLEVELGLRLLAYDAQVRPRCGLGHCLGVVVVVLLSLDERLHIDRRDDPRLVTQLTQRPADKVGAKARFHADHARRQPPECLNQRQSLDLATESNLAVGAKTDNVEDFLADVDANRGQGYGSVHGLLLRMLWGSLCRLSPRGCSRSILLADLTSERSNVRCGAQALTPHFRLLELGGGNRPVESSAQLLGCLQR